jgi:Ca2+-binding EF-hand superfamily protein
MGNGASTDRDGDGTASLEEFQTAHASIFKAMDADKDGTVSMEEMRNFFHGARKLLCLNNLGRRIKATDSQEIVALVIAAGYPWAQGAKRACRYRPGGPRPAAQVLIG